nr:MFS transporter [Pantoea anthophila]
MIFLFSLTSALAVANVYSAQPLLESIADSLQVSPGTTGAVVTATQAGYALGLIFLVPLGDCVNRKRMVLTQLLLSVLALTGAACAPDLMMLLWAMLLVGLMAVVTQVMVAALQSSLLFLIAGVILLDFAVQTVHVINQSLIVAARPEAASRLVGAYMCFYSLGSALGAIAATQIYAHWGWQAVCYAGGAVSASAFLCWYGARHA